MSQNNVENVQNFSDMVTATQKLTRPWMIFSGILIFALIATNLIWGVVHWNQLRYAYMTPEEYSQEQLFDEHAQSQHYSSGVQYGN